MKARTARGIFAALLILLLWPIAPEAAGPAITVSATSQTLLGVSAPCSLTATLIDPNNTGKVSANGSEITVLQTSTVTPGATCTVGALFGNDVITDAFGRSNTTYYKIQVFLISGGTVGSTPSLQAFYALQGSGTVDLSTATPLAPSFMAGPNGNVVTVGTLTATQFISTIATGTAPLVVASTTQVSNLNASQLGGLTPPASAIVGISDTQTLTAKTLASPTITTPTIDGTAAGHVVLQVSAATNYGTALGSQTIIASMPVTGNVSLLLMPVQVTAGVGCSAATNSVTVNPLTWTAPGGTVENINPSSNMGFTGNGVVDQGSSTFGSSGFTNNGIQAIVAKSGTAIAYSTTSTLASTGCSTVPQYAIYAKAIF